MSRLFFYGSLISLGACLGITSCSPQPKTAEGQDETQKLLVSPSPSMSINPGMPGIAKEANIPQNIPGDSPNSPARPRHPYGSEGKPIQPG